MRHDEGYVLVIIFELLVVKLPLDDLLNSTLNSKLKNLLSTHHIFACRSVRSVTFTAHTAETV